MKKNKTIWEHFSLLCKIGCFDDMKVVLLDLCMMNELVM